MIAAMTTLAVLAATANEPYSVARMTAYGEYFDGSTRVGAGSRQRYDGGAAGMEVEAVRVSRERDLGLEARLHLGGAFWTGRPRANRFIGFEIGGAAGIFSTESFGLAATIGLGIYGGRHAFVDTVRLYPYVGLRARAWMSQRVSLHVNVYLLPITSSGVRDSEVRGEVALGVGWFVAGLRSSWITYRGGDPRRTYGELALAPFVGAAFY